MLVLDGDLVFIPAETSSQVDATDHNVQTGMLFTLWNLHDSNCAGQSGSCAKFQAMAAGPLAVLPSCQWVA
jgi:hypothetical protein